MGHMIKMMESVRRAAKFPLETAELQRTLVEHDRWRCVYLSFYS
jgi:hypothetical protein